MLLGTTVRVSESSTGVQANGHSDAPVLSADANRISSHSLATTLFPNDTNGRIDVFLRDLTTSTTARISFGPLGAQPNGDCFNPVISGDGRYVAFESSATNVYVPDANATVPDAVRYDTQTGVTELLSASSDGVRTVAASLPSGLSADGSVAGFVS